MHFGNIRTPLIFIGLFASTVIFAQGNANKRQSLPNGPNLPPGSPGQYGQAADSCLLSEKPFVDGTTDPPKRCKGRMSKSGVNCDCVNIPYNEPGFWPPNRGCLDDPKPTKLKVGSRISRYGHPNGTFAAPAGQSFNQNSLPGGSLGDFNCWTVNCAMDVMTCTIAPWFGRTGGGIQYMFEQSVGTHHRLPIDRTAAA